MIRRHGLLTVDFFLLVFLVFNRRDIHDGGIREDQASLFEVFIAGKENGIEHRFVKQEIAHPFGNDDVVFLEW